MRILIVPGYTNSGPEHWQTHWERANPNYVRVEQDSWDFPVRDDWVQRLDEAVRKEQSPAVIVAHSLGCATVAHWAAQNTDTAPVAAALLVAPADVERAGFPEEITGFSPLPLNPLPFRSVLVASEDDEYVSIERAAQFARAWGSTLINVGRRGHIGSAAALGDWLDGQAILNDMLRDLQ
jgi:uncharacterized protein